MHAHRRCGQSAPAFILAFIILLILSFCDRVTAEVPGVRNDHSRLIAAPNINTSLRIPPTQDGLLGDGRTDNTTAFRALFGAGDRSIQIAAGTYITGKLVIPRNTVLLLDPGVVIKDSGRLGPNDRLINILDGNVSIRGRDAKVLSDRRYYTSGEQRHGVFIYGASNVFIDGLESSSTGGDGFYIGGPHNNPAQHITLENCFAFNNRRQGLSITSARDVTVTHCTFSLTQGTAPAYGVDLEPNYPSDSLKNIRLLGVRTESNYGGGILVALGQLHGSTTPISIEIIDHLSISERHPYTVIRPRDVSGELVYTPSR